jgi:hypothetical protein
MIKLWKDGTETRRSATRARQTILQLCSRHYGQTEGVAFDFPFAAERTTKYQRFYFVDFVVRSICGYRESRWSAQRLVAMLLSSTDFCRN